MHTAEGGEFGTPRKLTHEQARQEQRLAWTRLTPQERLRAMTELTRRLYALRGIDIDEYTTDWSVRRIRRGPR